MKTNNFKTSEVQKALDNLLSYTNVKKVKEDFKKSFEYMKPEQVDIVYEKKDNMFKVIGKIQVNDIIEFEENNTIQKAVVSAIGKHGVTARDKEQRQLKIYYRNILRHKRRD